MKQTKTIVIATHRRSGTHWTLDALRNNSPDVNATFMTLEETSPKHHHHLPLNEFQQKVASLDGRVLIKVHDLPSASYWHNEAEKQYAYQIMNESPTIYVHRDGRDVMVSLYYYIKSFREDYATISFSDFIRMDHELDGDPAMNRPAFWQYHAQVWMAQEDRCAISYQSLENDYENTLQQLAEFLQVRLNPQIQSIALKSKPSAPNFLQKVKRKIARQTTIKKSAVTPRKGTSGDWRSHFTDDDLKFFMKNAGEMMRELGYVD